MYACMCILCKSEVPNQEAQQAQISVLQTLADSTRGFRKSSSDLPGTPLAESQREL